MKFKRIIILFFVLLAYLLISLSIKFGVDNLKNYFGLITGLGLMIISIPIHLLGKRFSIFYFFSYLFNSIGVGLSISTYYRINELNPSDKSLLITSLICFSIILIISLLTRHHKIKPYAKLIVSLLILTLFITSIFLWVINDKAIYSLLFYFLNISYFYMVCIITASLNITSLLRKISILSFGTFLVVSIIVLIIISEGDGIEEIGQVLLEGIEGLASPSTKNKRNANLTY